MVFIENTVCNQFIKWFKSSALYQRIILIESAYDYYNNSSIDNKFNIELSRQQICYVFFVAFLRDYVDEPNTEIKNFIEPNFIEIRERALSEEQKQCYKKFSTVLNDVIEHTITIFTSAQEVLIAEPAQKLDLTSPREEERRWSYLSTELDSLRKCKDLLIRKTKPRKTKTTSPFHQNYIFYQLDQKKLTTLRTQHEESLQSSYLTLYDHILQNQNKDALKQYPSFKQKNYPPVKKTDSNIQQILEALKSLSCTEPKSKNSETTANKKQKITLAPATNFFRPPPLAEAVKEALAVEEALEEDKNL